MKIAITGGTGFVGGHVAEMLKGSGHQVVIISRSSGVDLDDCEALIRALAGSEGVAHCAGINREIGDQTYEKVHVQGTSNVIEAARRVGVKKVVMISFLRARANCGSGYHESKYAAEEIVRKSGLDYTILKCGVIYGRGDHMLDHLSHAFYTFPVFGLVGLKDRSVAPMTVEDVARLVVACLIDGNMSRKTVAVVEPEKMALGEAVTRVAEVCGKKPWMVRLPVAFHYALAWVCERIMKLPLLSLAQARILAEGIVDPAGECEWVPQELAPRTKFTREAIQRGLPARGPFRCRDCRWCFS